MKLGELVALLGSDVVQLVTASCGTEGQVGSVAVHDGTEPLAVEPGTLVCAVGAAAAYDLLADLEHRPSGACALAGLLVKGDMTFDGDLRERSERLGLAVLRAPQALSWTRLLAVLGAALAPAGFGDGDSQAEALGGDDLFMLADAIAEMVGAPVTIEDRQWRVLAYSASFGDADRARTETVLAQRTPGDYVEQLAANGDLSELAHATEPLYFGALDDRSKPRMAISVRAGEELLGSMWAAVAQPMTSAQADVFRRCADVVAVAILRRRLLAEPAARAASQLAHALLYDGATATLPAHLPLPPGGLRVVAVNPGEAGDATAHRRLARLEGLLRMYLSSYRVPAVTAVEGERLYAIVASSKAGADLSLRLLLTDFVQRLGQGADAQVVLGVGGHAANARHLPRSRQQADIAVRIARRSARHGRVVSIDDVVPQALLVRVSDALAVEPVAADGPLALLRQVDEERGADYVETLRAYLEHFGDIVAAADALRVHANTLRYRLRKMREIAGIDLTDHDQRLGLAIQLFALAPDPRPASQPLLQTAAA
jgi:hypothetical protein